MITIDPNLKVGGLAIADGIEAFPVKILRLGKIFAKVKDIVTGYQWELMANRLVALNPNEQTNNPQDGGREEGE